METEKYYFFTFGSGHAHPNGFVKLYGTFGSTRGEMVRRYGDKWSAQYDSAAAAGVERWSLCEVDTTSSPSSTPYETNGVGPSCDDCCSQEGKHYCLLHTRQMKNMDMQRCDFWSERQLSGVEDPGIADLKSSLAKLRTALVALVGADGKEDLEKMKACMCQIGAPPDVQAVTIQAINALLEVPKS
jgi:hypothetical protein